MRQVSSRFRPWLPSDQAPQATFADVDCRSADSRGSVTVAPKTAGTSRQRGCLMDHHRRASNEARPMAQEWRRLRWSRLWWQMLDPTAVASASLAALAFCLLSSGFYLVNDVRNPRRRSTSSGQAPAPRSRRGLRRDPRCYRGYAHPLGHGGSALLGWRLLLVFLAYAGLMAAYNLGVKEIVILDDSQSRPGLFCARSEAR